MNDGRVLARNNDGRIVLLKLQFGTEGGALSINALKLMVEPTYYVALCQPNAGVMQLDFGRSKSFGSKRRKRQAAGN